MTIAAALLAPGTAVAAEVTAVGPGSSPGVAVDAAGTAYVAWVGPEPNTTTLRFCRLARGATACDAGGASSIPAPGTSSNRPVVAVTGERVVVIQYRHGPGVPDPAVAGSGQNYRFTSRDRGATFTETRVVGNVEFDEAVVGPGETVSGATHGTCSGMCFQNVVLDGPAPVGAGGSQVPWATLSSDRPYHGAVGLLDAATPLTVFSDLAGNQRFRRYSGSGEMNHQASWTPPVDLGAGLEYPKLAGGPSGLFMLGNVGRDVVVRKFDGTTFGPALQIGSEMGTEHHLVQDAGGRLHAVWSRFGGTDSELVHAVSDDGTSWSSRVVVIRPTASGLNDPRVATAADHAGVVVWWDREAVRVTAVGPGAPSSSIPIPTSTAAPVTAPAPVALASARGTFFAPGKDLPRSVKSTGRGRKRKVVLKVRGRLGVPGNVSKQAACQGYVTVTVTAPRRVVSTRKARLSPITCKFAKKVAFRRKRLRKVTVTLAFAGNTTVGRARYKKSIKLI